MQVNSSNLQTTAQPSEMGVVFSYDGNNVTMRNENGVVYINLTEVAKSFPSKNLTQIINSLEIREYCEELTKLQNYSLTDLLKVTRGGNNNGTWAHQKVAIRVAQKLSPKFAVWVDSKIEELLTAGVATISNEDEMIAKAMQVLNQRLEKAKQEKLQMQSTIDQQAVTIDLQNQELTTQAPKVQYYDNVLQSKSTYTTTQIAKELGMSARQLNKKLQTLKFIFHQSGMWMLTAKYQNKGYATTKTYSYTNSIGQTCTNTATVYTEKGREFIHSLLT